MDLGAKLDETMGEKSTVGLETVPFDVYDLVAAYLLPHEMATLCLVSRGLHRAFGPILWRKLRLRWPETGRRQRFDAGRLLGSKFDAHVASLELDLAMRRKANCSWPLAGFTKHRRRDILRRLKADGKVKSVVLQQLHFTPIHGLGPMLTRFPEWAGNLLAGLQGLRRLTLAGSAFLDAPAAVADLLHASRGLQVLEVYSRPDRVGWGVRRPDTSSNIVVGQTNLFWARLIGTISAKPAAAGAGAEPRERPWEPPLRLHTLAVDEYAVADFARLTDLSRLRRLRLLNRPSSGISFHTRNPAKAYQFSLPSAAAAFGAATRLRALEVTTFTETIMGLVTHLQAESPGVLSDLRTDTGDPKLAERTASLPLRALRLFPVELNYIMKTARDAEGQSLSMLEHLTLTYCEDNAQGQRELLDVLSIHPMLRSVFIYVDVAPPRNIIGRRNKLPSQSLPKWASSIFKAHEEAVVASGLLSKSPRRRQMRSRLLEVTFTIKTRPDWQWPEMRVQQHVFFKSWDDRVPAVRDADEAGRKTDEASGSGSGSAEAGGSSDGGGLGGGGWHLGSFSHMVPRDEDYRY